MACEVSGAKVLSHSRNVINTMFAFASSVDELSTSNVAGIQCTPYAQLHRDWGPDQRAFVAVHVQRQPSSNNNSQACSSALLLYDCECGDGQVKHREHAAFALTPGVHTVRTAQQIICGIDCSKVPLSYCTAPARPYMSEATLFKFELLTVCPST